MRILFLNHNIVRRGGTFYRAFDIGRYLVQRGQSVTLLTISADRRWGFGREVNQGVEIIHTPDLLWGPGRTGWDPWDVGNRLAYLYGQVWDIIHAWDCRPAVILPALYAHAQSQRSGGQLVIDWCDWFGRGGTQAERPGRLAKLLYGRIETYFEEAFRTRANGSTVISQMLFERAVGLGVRPETIRLLRQGCDLEAAPASDRSAARQRLGVPDDKPMLVCVGALLPTDAELLFEMLRRFFQLRPNSLVVLIGKHGARLPDDLRSASQLVETGFVPAATLHDYMAACDALLTPMADTLASRARWPSKINPFLAAGRAVIVSRVGDLPAWLAQEDAALVVSCEPDDIARQAAALMANPEQRRYYEHRARHIAETQLAWPVIVQHLEEFYVQLKGSTQ